MHIFEVYKIADPDSLFLAKSVLVTGRFLDFGWVHIEWAHYMLIQLSNAIVGGTIDSIVPPILGNIQGSAESPK